LAHNLGQPCAIFILQVRLASVFGLLTFLLNYIPNVGSMIAMLLPIPVIYVDDELSPATVTL
jgi:AI-2 transport protein TqsA